jgi:hypothetical protein
MGDRSLEALWSRYQRAKKRRRCWESLWRDCYTYALPQRGAGLGPEFATGTNHSEHLFEPDHEELCRAFARCFAGTDGQRVAEHLKRLILDRRLLPSASDAELWHAEGQRFAVAYVMSMAARGRE